ncbi:ParB/RepB/Spo0J family partition protein [Sphingomonas sp. MA1305]|jgi:ParB family chromosome partitioning protein|uniref:ParB/RepB/Spo0J family partition protein n=1 Tax=Sphingomonas sp. MA1305 TaxID=2479204 RepID=UPI0018DFE68E|nr:ParB/RepB/Spo0J family partition protein [Sphingomonas sp. MA1305]MBI0477066.1 ParB/RepB/Spo0J family partition protein [Sphingomonas sp. MA1305]
MIQTVKLAKLRLSPINVRTAPDKDLAIEPLAAAIQARGVLQNLLITPVTKPRGHFEVFDGGRRLRALHLLVEQGQIAADDYDVPVMVLKADASELSETSLAANFHQLKLTPAEECRAFHHFLGKDGDIDAVAKRFGQTRRFIEGRLRLATLAEPIFDALAAGEITLDIAKAYASTESHDKQLMVWGSYGQNGYANADMIRRVIANETMKSTDPVAILVGEDAYAAAGGRVDRDLFSDAGDRWTDPEIAQRLGAEIMEAEARRIGEETGLGWIRPVASSSTWNAAAGLHRVVLPTVPPTEEETARMDEIDARLEAIYAEMEDEALPEEDYARLDAEADALGEDRERLSERPTVLPDELKPQVGVFLTLTPRGEMVVEPTYYSEQPIRADDADAGDTGGATAGPTGRGEPQVPALRPEAVAPGGKALSASLYDKLAIQRRDILAAALLGHPGLALDFALFAMVDARSRHGQYGTSIHARPPLDPTVGEVPGSRARSDLAEAREELDAGWTESACEVERFEAFRVLADDAKAGWLAWAVATSLEAKPTYATRQNPLQNRLATIMEIDVAAWWRPTSENFFDRVTKSALLSLLDEVGGPALSGRHAAQKKSEISASCEKLFAGEAIVEAEVKEKALAWVPNAMRFLDGVEPDGFDDRADESGDDDADLGDADPVAGEGDEALTDAEFDEPALVAAE